MLYNTPKQLSKQAKGVFAALLNELGNDQATTINRGGEGIMPVVIERLEGNLKTTWGIGYLVSIAHYYEQNGDLMRDPEIVYLVVDNRIKPGDLDLLGVWPAQLTNDTLGIFKELLIFESDVLKQFSKHFQADAAVFSTTWLNNIRHQQKINPVREEKPMDNLKMLLRRANDAAKKLGYKNLEAAIEDGKEDEIKKLIGK